MDILYDTVEQLGALFATPGDLDAALAIDHACKTATSWDEFTSRVQAAQAWDFLQSVGFEPDEIETAEDFNPAEVPGFEEGGPLMWLGARMLGWFPPDLAVHYGEQFEGLTHTVLLLPGERADEIAGALTLKGYGVARDPDGRLKSA